MINHNPSLFFILPLAISFLLIILFLFVIYKNPRSLVNLSFSLTVSSAAVWLYSYAQAYQTLEQEVALFWFKVGYWGVIFISITYFHFTSVLLKIKITRWIIVFNYLVGLIFGLLVLKTNLLIDGVHHYTWGFYPKAGKIHPYFLIFFLGVVNAASFQIGYTLFRHKQINAHNRTQQLKYVLLAFSIFTLASIDFLPNYGIKIYPLGFIPATLFLITICYSIVRYELMDIKLAITQTSIFLFVYSIVLGIPLGLSIWGRAWLTKIFNQEWFWAPMSTLLILATAGPFILLYFQKKAEAILLQEEQRLQELLEQASYGMNSIHNLPKLLNLMIDVIVKTLRVDSVRIFLLDRQAEKYILKAPEDKREIVLDKEHPFILQVKKQQAPLVHDEIKMLSEGGDAALSQVESQMRNLSASIIVPIVLNNSLLGFLTLGERKSKAMYTSGLLNTLSILGNQAGLAIDRCNYIAAETKRLEAEGLKERMVSLDHMASSMAHEIDNPMHVIRISLSFAQDALLKDPRVSMPADIKQDFDDSLTRSLSASERVSSMIKAILDYSRMGTGTLKSIRISDALEGFWQLIQPQIRQEKVQFIKEIEDDLPPVLGDQVEMEEVFMNFVRNSLHAVRRNEEKKITLKIFRKNEHTIRIECADNGYGIPKEIINDIFLSSMTTKGSSEGTGLGLYRVRKIVDLFRGKVWAESEGKGKGARFIVELPVYPPSPENHGRNSADEGG